MVEASDVKARIMRYAFYERGHTATVTEGLRNADVLSVKGTTAYEFEIKVSKSDLDKEIAAINYALAEHEGRGIGRPDTPEQEAINATLFDLKKKSGGWSKISKHKEHLNAVHYFDETPSWAYGHRYIPNYFYLVVPNNLVQHAIDNTPSKFGVIAYNGCRSEGEHYGYFANGKWYERYDEKPEDAKWMKGVPCDPTRCYEEVSVKRAAKKLHDREISLPILMSILARAVQENITLLETVCYLNDESKRLPVEYAQLGPLIRETNDDA